LITALDCTDDIKGIRDECGGRFSDDCGSKDKQTEVKTSNGKDKKDIYRLFRRFQYQHNWIFRRINWAMKIELEPERSKITVDWLFHVAVIIP